MCLLMLIPTVIRLIVERTHAWLTKETELDDKVDLGLLLDHQKVLMSQYLRTNEDAQLHSGGPLLTDNQSKGAKTKAKKATAEAHDAGTTATRNQQRKAGPRLAEKDTLLKLTKPEVRRPHTLGNGCDQPMKHISLDPEGEDRQQDKLALAECRVRFAENAENTNWHMDSQEAQKLQQRTYFVVLQ